MDQTRDQNCCPNLSALAKKPFVKHSGEPVAPNRAFCSSMNLTVWPPGKRFGNELNSLRRKKSPAPSNVRAVNGLFAFGDAFLSAPFTVRQL
jgi:hypothetical protein